MNIIVRASEIGLQEYRCLRITWLPKKRFGRHLYRITKHEEQERLGTCRAQCFCTWGQCRLRLFWFKGETPSQKPTHEHAIQEAASPRIVIQQTRIDLGHLLLTFSNLACNRRLQPVATHTFHPCLYWTSVRFRGNTAVAGQSA